MSLRIANYDELLTYRTDFLANVTELFVGGIVLSNPRPFVFNETDIPVR